MDPTQKSENSVLIAHLADTHLRDSQYATARRSLDFFDAFKRAVLLSLDADVDVIVLVGDIFDRPRPSPKIIGQLLDIDRILIQAGVVMLATTGNHDWNSPTWLSMLFADRVPLVTKPGATPSIGHHAGGIYPMDGITAEFRGVTFTGIHPHGASSFRNEMAAIEAQARGVDVVLYHGFVDGVTPTSIPGVSAPLLVSELPVAKDNAAWLLGDIHTQAYRDIDRPGGGTCLVGYPGSLEMCSSSESVSKSVPIIEVTKSGKTSSARVVKTIPAKIRPFIKATVNTEEDLDILVTQLLTPVADQHPVVNVEFNREITQTINRIHSVLDAHRAVVRCYPLPLVKTERMREEENAGTDLTMEYFVEQRFKDSPELAEVALALLTRGDTDAANITAEFVEKRKEAVSASVREET